MSEQKARTVIYTVSTGEKYTRITEALTDEELERVATQLSKLKLLESLVIEPQDDGGGYVVVNPDHLVSIELS